MSDAFATRQQCFSHLVKWCICCNANEISHLIIMFDDTMFYQARYLVLPGQKRLMILCSIKKSLTDRLLVISRTNYSQSLPIKTRYHFHFHGSSRFPQAVRINVLNSTVVQTELWLSEIDNLLSCGAQQISSLDVTCFAWLVKPGTFLIWKGMQTNS